MFFLFFFNTFWFSVYFQFISLKSVFILILIKLIELSSVVKTLLSILSIVFGISFLLQSMVIFLVMYKEWLWSCIIWPVLFYTFIYKNNRKIELKNLIVNIKRHYEFSVSTTLVIMLKNLMLFIFWNYN